MSIFSVLSNNVKAAIGYQQSFDELLEANDISRALSMMSDLSPAAVNALKDYKIGTHKINERKDKAVLDKKGNFLRWAKRWKIPQPYQEYINEIALVFLYGRPVRWIQLTDDTDEAFENYIKLNDKIRFNSVVREAKRAAGAAGTSAIIYHCYQDNGEPKLRLKCLSKENDDDLFYIKDQYGSMRAFAWSYELTDAGNKTVQHVDIYTDEMEYHCKRAAVGWDVTSKPNPIGKIPVLLFEQEPEAATVQPMIERVENMESVDADVVDRFANPALVATADVLNSLPKEEEEAKLFILKNGGELKYLTWDQSSESKEKEYQRLDNKIFNFSFTPQINLEALKGMGNLSGKAIIKVFLMAKVKADKHKEKHDGYMNRHAHLMLAILANVLDYRNAAQYNKLQIGHEFQEPFGDDQSETLTDALKQFGAGALSLQTLLELSYLVKNPTKEYGQIQDDLDDATERQKAINRTDVFGGGE
jgi:SPP1 family phage portal protein